MLEFILLGLIPHAQFANDQLQCLARKYQGHTSKLIKMLKSAGWMTKSQLKCSHSLEIAWYHHAESVKMYKN